MTDFYYNHILMETCELLLKAVNGDLKFVESKPIPNLLNALDAIGDSYVKYTQIANKFNHCYKGILHPQIRKELIKLLNMIYGRLLEIKHEMVGMELSDFQYLDNIIIANNITRWDLELDIPEEYRIQRKEQLEMLDRKYERILEDEERERLEEAFETGEWDEDASSIVIVGRLSELSEISGFDQRDSKHSKYSTAPSAPSRIESEKKRPRPKHQITAEDLARIEFIKVIQKHERARITRLLVQKEMERMRLRNDIMNMIYEPVPLEKQINCVQIIQRYWHRYRMKRKARYTRDQRRLLLDMYLPSYQDKKHVAKLLQIEDEIRQRQSENIKVMQDIAFIYKMRMDKKKDIIQSDLVMELMYYVKEWYEITRAMDNPSLPEWPDEKALIPPFRFLGLPKKMSEAFIEEQDIAQYDVINILLGHQFDPLAGSELITAKHWVPPEIWSHIKRALAEAIAKENENPTDGEMLKEMVIKEYCVLPLANSTVRATTKLIPSVLFVGPKYFTDQIVEAICTEAGALLFYIDPLQVADKFEAKMLIHLLTKVPKLFEPAVVHVDDVEKPYYKKLPPEEADRNPLFLRTILRKLTKAINKWNRVILIGTSDKPWAAKSKPLFGVFSKVIPIPDLDHHTISKYWKELLMKYHGIARGIDYTSLANVSKANTLVEINKTTTNLLTSERIVLLQCTPLKQEELEIILPAPQLGQSYWTWAKENAPLFLKRTKMLKNK